MIKGGILVGLFSNMGWIANWLSLFFLSLFLAKAIEQWNDVKGFA